MQVPRRAARTADRSLAPYSITICGPTKPLRKAGPLVMNIREFKPVNGRLGAEAHPLGANQMKVSPRLFPGISGRKPLVRNRPNRGRPTSPEWAFAFGKRPSGCVLPLLG